MPDRRLTLVLFSGEGHHFLTLRREIGTVIACCGLSKLLNGAFALLGPRPFHYHVEAGLAFGFLRQRHQLSASGSCSNPHAVQHPGLAALVLAMSPLFRAQLGLGLLSGLQTWRHEMPSVSASLLGQARPANLSLEASGTLHVTYYGTCRSTPESQPSSPQTAR